MVQDLSQREPGALDSGTGGGVPGKRKTLPRWLSAVLVSGIVALLATGFLLVILLAIGQVVRPGAVGLYAALQLAIPIFVMSFAIYVWKTLRQKRD